MMKIIIFVASLAYFVACIASHHCGKDNQQHKSQCPRDNEVWDPCPPPCPPQICSSIYSRLDCTEANANYTSNCKGQCQCKDGYYRNAINECISTEDCLRCTGPNEYFSCGGACDNICDTLKNQNQTSCNIINIVCNRMCYCVEGYARNDDGVCVPFAECPVKCPGENEYYERCALSCPLQTCDSLNSDNQYNCPEDDGSCRPACRCIDGFYRNQNGVCRPRQECN